MLRRMGNTPRKKGIFEAMKLFRKGVKLGMLMTSQNVTDFDRKTIRFASPRIMPVVSNAQDDDEIKILSPSLLSLHDEGKGLEKMLSLSGAMKAAKLLENHDHDALMNFIMEATGITDAADKIRKKKLAQLDEREKKFIGIDGQPMYFTRKNVTDLYGDGEAQKIDVFEQLQESLSDNQIDKLNTTGYAMMQADQLYTLYGPNSPYSSPEVLVKFANLSDDEILEKLIISDIVRLSKSEKVFVERHKKRSKRTVALSPLLKANLILKPATVSQTIVLSPLVLSPIILSPAALGPIILSPWVFIPLILSPRVLSPLILTPLVGSPVILSPLVLHPFILSPGVMNPFILSPLLLSPLILSPQVLTPLILTPLCLNPLILSPAVLSPLVLSPFVLSPLILSSQLLFGLFFSPYAFSPLILTNLTLSAIVASPSFMS
ncbi:unnamed protein product [Dracunculus medinensis]|uniref:Tail-specific protease n=1 Tax=Dracunculus medinensis TaxID=318479 RepID=A0A0N4U3B8_DRAME|nr:unnamed protein product [Dracunculus medinensis]